MKEKSSGSLIVVSLALIPMGTVWSGYALSVLWGWFIVPAFHTEHLRIPFAIGLSTIASYLTYQFVDCQKSSESANSKMLLGIGIMIFRPALALLFGWIIQKFI